MKEQVTDISAMLKSLMKDMQSMRETIDAQHTEIVSLNRKIGLQRRIKYCVSVFLSMKIQILT